LKVAFGYQSFSTTINKPRSTINEVMPSQIQNLDRESLLMLYVADELSAEDRQRVEEMLANDPGLRAQLDELTAAQDVMAGVFSEADANRPLPAPVWSSVRRMSAAMAQWQIDRMAKPAQTLVHHGRKLGWLYASGAIAAGIIITIFVLWSRVDDGRNPMAKMPWEDQDKQADVAQDTSADAPTSDVQEADATPLRTVDPDDFTPGGVGDSDRQLTSAEGELYTLSTLSASVRPTEDTVTP
jgi:hypothetical protein